MIKNTYSFTYNLYNKYTWVLTFMCLVNIKTTRYLLLKTMCNVTNVNNMNKADVN